MSPAFDRRAFLKLMGGGIVVLVRLRPEGALAQGRGYPTDLNAYLRIGEDGRVTVFSGKIEMGQGVTTSLAQMAAEDLGVNVLDGRLSRPGDERAGAGAVEHSALTHDAFLRHPGRLERHVAHNVHRVGEDDVHGVGR